MKQEEILRMLLIRLENIQRGVGEVQKQIIALLGEEEQIVLEPTPPAPTAIEELEEEPELADLQIEPPSLSCIDLIAWLKERNIDFLRTVATSEFDETFDRLARFLGERFQNLRPFYDAIKRRVSGSAHPRALKLTNAPPQMISDICQFGTDLFNNGFLKRYHYTRGTRTLVFEPQMDGRVINFFTGDWLERYVLLTTLERIKTLLPEGVCPEALTKAVVVLPDGQETELDILLGLPERVLWLECKTGDWQEHAVRFGRIARQLQIPPQQAALVLLESLTAEQKRNASVLSGMSAINPEELEDFIATALGASATSPS